MSTVTLDEMRGSLLSLDSVREVLEATEPLSELGLTVGSTHFTLGSGWNHGLDTIPDNAPVEAHVEVGGTEIPLSKAALLQATSKVGLPAAYVKKTPASLIEANLNYWYGDEGGLGDKQLKLLVTRDLGSAVTASTINPFSNLRLLDEALAGVEKKFGKGEVLVDSKFHHSLTRTNLRLIIPEHIFTVSNSKTPNDVWSMGLNLQNSLTGDSGAQTSLDGYLFRWWCTNGAIDTHASSGTWSRKSGGQDAESVYEWARESVDDVLGGLESAFGDLEQMARTPVAGDVNQLLRETFQAYSLPARSQRAIINNMVDDDEMTMYSLMQAITSVANAADMSPREQATLMTIGGNLVYASNDRCDSCHQLVS